MQRGGPVKRETEIGVSLIHVKGSWGSRAFGGRKALPTSSSQTSGLQTLREKKFLLF